MDADVVSQEQPLAVPVPTTTPSRCCSRCSPPAAPRPRGPRAHTGHRGVPASPSPSSRVAPGWRGASSAVTSAAGLRGDAPAGSAGGQRMARAVMTLAAAAVAVGANPGPAPLALAWLPAVCAVYAYVLPPRPAAGVTLGALAVLVVLAAAAGTAGHRPSTAYAACAVCLIAAGLAAGTLRAVGESRADGPLVAAGATAEAAELPAVSIPSRWIPSLPTSSGSSRTAPQARRPPASRRALPVYPGRTRCSRPPAARRSDQAWSAAGWACSSSPCRASTSCRRPSARRRAGRTRHARSQGPRLAARRGRRRVARGRPARRAPRGRRRPDPPRRRPSPRRPARRAAGGGAQRADAAGVPWP